MPGTADGTCRLCGTLGTGQAFASWVKPTFTDHDRVRPGTIICHACLFCTLHNSTWLAEHLGREKPQRMRNYSHFVLEGAWHCVSKAEKARMRTLLARDPEVVVLADSGQRHLVFRARPGCWQFELHTITPEWERLAAHLGKKWSQGWGAVLQWDVEPWPEDWSVTGPGGRLMRAVYDPEGTTQYGIRPSYWHPRNQFPCRLPGGSS
jgi:hypothetical protein